MNLSEIFSLTYLLDKNPTGDFLWGFPLLAFFFLALSLSSILKNPAKKNKYLKKSLRKKLWPFQILGGLGIMLILARFSNMETISMPILLIAILVITIIFAGIQFFRVWKEYSRRITSAQREQDKKK
jgi:uncharacterized membrane protein